MIVPSVERAIRDLQFARRRYLEARGLSERRRVEVDEARDRRDRADRDEASAQQEMFSARDYLDELLDSDTI